MKASELAKLLLALPGDPEIYAQDGYDPSDPERVSGMKPLEEYDNSAHRYVEQPGKILLETDPYYDQRAS